MCHITLVNPRGSLVGSTSMDPYKVLGTRIEDDSNSYKDATAFDDVPHYSALVKERSISHA